MVTKYILKTKAKCFAFFSMLTVFTFLLVPETATADTQLEALFEQPCTRYSVPKALVLAIARTESSMHPWTVNIAGKSYQPATREEALRLIRTARARRLSHDIGIMQINNWWLSYLRISPETAIEPANNALLGVWILAKEIKRYGVSWKAVGAYHSPTPSRQLQYARAVARQLKGAK